MFGLPVILLIALALSGLSWAVSRYGSAGRLGRVYQQAYRDWESGDLDSAYGGYQELQELAGKIRDRSSRLAYQFITCQALGAIDRSRHQYFEAATQLQQALNLVDEEVDQTSEVVLVTCVELCFALSSLEKHEQASVIALRIEEELDAMVSDDQATVCKTLLPHLVAVAGDPTLYPPADAILLRMATRMAKLMETEPTGKTLLSPQSSSQRPIKSGSGSHSGINAFRAPAEVSECEDLDPAQAVWIASVLGRTTLAESVSEHATALQLIDQVQSSPLWWKLNPSQTARGNELRARIELHSGSVSKALELGRGVFNMRVQDGDDPFVLASTEVGLSSFLRARGIYRESLEHAKAAYDRVQSAAQHRYHLSSWYPNLYALALIELGDYDEAWPLLDQARGQESHDATPFSDAYTLMLQAIYMNGLGSVDLAEARIQESLRTVSQAYGEDSQLCLEQRIFLVGILLLQERLDDAEREIDLVESATQDRDLRSAYSLCQGTLVLIAFDIQRGRLAVAEEKLLLLQRDLRKELLPHHHIFVNIQHMMGSIHQAVGDATAAIRALEESRRLRALTQRKDAPDFHGTLVMLTELYRGTDATNAEREIREQLSAVEAYRDRCRGIENVKR